MITTSGGESCRRATTSQPLTSPLTSKPSLSRKRLTGKYRVVSKTMAQSIWAPLSTDSRLCKRKLGTIRERVIEPFWRCRPRTLHGDHPEHDSGSRRVVMMRRSRRALHFAAERVTHTVSVLAMYNFCLLEIDLTGTICRPGDWADIAVRQCTKRRSR